MARARLILHCASLCLLASIAVALPDPIPLPQATTYYFSGAVQVQGSAEPCETCGSTPAQEAQCPAGYPQGCSSIGAPNYCCPSGNTCAWSNSEVACCPEGCQCEAHGGYEPSSWYQSTTPWSTWYETTTPCNCEEESTIYQTPASTYYVQQTTPGVVIVPAGQTTPYAEYQTTTVGQYGNGQYCSTLVEVGPNLPTTAQGECGTILVVAKANAASLARVWMRTVALVVALQILGALVFIYR